MKIAVGTDESSAVVEFVLEELKNAGHSVSYAGPLAGEEQLAVENYWPAVARRVAEEVAAGRADEGVLFCWTGTGVSLAANKVKGIRSALCADA